MLSVQIAPRGDSTGVILFVVYFGALETGLHSRTIPHLVYRSLPLSEMPTSSETSSDDHILKRRLTTTKSTEERLICFVSEQGLLKIH
jgi:hypothetical protein